MSANEEQAPSASGESRRKPNILVTGTPGTGKSTLCDLLQENIGFQTINVGKLIQENNYHSGRDEDFDSYVLDEDSEDKLLDEMEDMLKEGGKVVEFHASQLFPERWFDLVVVLRTDNTELYDRLVKREYSEKKIKENIEAEILQICEDEARENYKPEVVVSLTSNEVEDLEAAADRIEQWTADWLNKKKQTGTAET
eukprot:gb/GECG01005359.1/.p1 GENE.gb/GECG01005359.1/~~gb/GECG01005359.1/.p1  ORF type:complete len:197 (+),score=43.19 gb/GECG01005359.1/:1-591(+)